MATQPNENINIYWSEEDQSFICQSSLYPDIIGIGDTDGEARQVYYELLEDYFESCKPANNKGGRPKKTNTKLTYNVPVEIKAFIELEALRNNINQGLVIEKIVNFYRESNRDLLDLYE